MLGSGKLIFEKNGANNADIINAINRLLPLAIKQTSSIANSFKGSNDKETAFNLWRFLRLLTYKRDSDDNQVIQLPSRLLATKSGDCKSYSLFTAAILSNLKIPFVFRYTNYDYGYTPKHVYVVANIDTTPIIIDGVYSLFDAEKKYNYKKDMKVSGIAGFNKSYIKNDTILNYNGIGDVTDDLSSAGGSAAGTALLGPGLGTVIGGAAGKWLSSTFKGLFSNKTNGELGQKVRQILETSFLRGFTNNEVNGHVAIINKNYGGDIEKWYNGVIVPSQEYKDTQAIRNYYNSLGVPFDNSRMKDFVYAEKMGNYTRAFLTEQAKSEFGNKMNIFNSSGASKQQQQTTPNTLNTGTNKTLLIVGGLGLAGLVAFALIKRK